MSDIEMETFLSYLGDLYTEGLTRQGNCAHAPDVQCKNCASSITDTENPREVGLDPAPSFFAGTPFKSPTGYERPEEKIARLVAQREPGTTGGAARYNAGKPRLSMISPYALDELAKVYMKGAEKYSAYNWKKGLGWTDLLDCTLRHISKILKGQDIDEETGCLHVALAMWNLATLTEQYTTHPELDNRYKGEQSA